MFWFYFSIFFPIGLILLCIYYSMRLKRNYQVYHYRMRLIGYIFDKGRADFNYDWQKGIKILDSVTYDDMMRNIFKPVDSYYTKEQLVQMGVKNENPS